MKPIFKPFLPKSLFGRALLILVLPMVLTQVVMAYIFFDRHWETVTRYRASSLAGEMIFLVGQLKSTPAQHKTRTIVDFEEATDIEVYFDPLHSFESVPASDDYDDFQQQLRRQIKEPLIVHKLEASGEVEVLVRFPDQTLRMVTSIKRLESRTTVIFILWMVGSSGLFLMIALVFLRNQIRPIRRLAEAADNFGRGVDTPGFRPHGAEEVRKASRAFMIMRERIKRQIRTRTDMLSGISHDLRTPLTRMKLQLAMLPQEGNIGEAVAELGGDVQQMEHMIGEYLDFARGEGREEATLTNLRELLHEVTADYRRLGQDVGLHTECDVSLMIRSSGFRRMLHNLIDNAIRYGKHCEVTLRSSGQYCEILIDDKGPGIPADKRDEVFKPFSRLDPSRNVNTGGVGLGLTIARDVVLAHGGSIALDISPGGGLRVVIKLPL